MWIRGNHKNRYTKPSSWHLFKEAGLTPKFVRSYHEDGNTKSVYVAADTMKSIDGYTWWETEVQRSEELPKKGKICASCLQRYLSESRIP